MPPFLFDGSSVREHCICDLRSRKARVVCVAILFDGSNVLEHSIAEVVQCVSPFCLWVPTCWNIPEVVPLLPFPTVSVALVLQLHVAVINGTL